MIFFCMLGRDDSTIYLSPKTAQVNVFSLEFNDLEILFAKTLMVGRLPISLCVKIKMESIAY